MTKKIIFSNYDSLKNPFYAGGGSVTNHYVAKNLAKKYEVVFYTGRYLGSKNEVVDNVSYVRIGSSLFGPKLGQLIFQGLLPFYVMTKKFDVWMESFTPPFSTAFLPLFTKKPVIGVTHSLSGEEMSNRYKIPFYLIERLGLKTYKYIIVLSLCLKDKIQSINPKAQIEIIPNGLEEKIINQLVQNQPEHILFIGRISMEEKGLDLLLKAYSCATGLSTPLIIAGSGLESEEIKLVNMINDYGLKDKVKWVGRVIGENKIELMRKSLFLVVPSRNESFANVALEAFSFNLPIICFDIPGLCWIPNKYAIKVKSFDEKALSKSMIDLVNKNELRVEMGRGAKVFVRNFSWDTTVNQYLFFLDKILMKK